MQFRATMPSSPMASPISPTLSPQSPSSGDEQPVWTTGRESISSRHNQNHPHHLDHRRRLHTVSPIINPQPRASSIHVQYSSGTSSPYTPSPSTPLTHPSFSLAVSPEDPNDLDQADLCLTLPLLSPDPNTTTNPPSDKIYQLHQPKSLAGIALRSFCLGIALTIGTILTLTTFLQTSTPLWRLPFFLASLSLFHFLEFFTTAAYNTREANISSFLLTANWPAYAIAHSFASVECLVVNVLWPDRSWSPLHTGPLLCLLGLGLTVIGQIVRSVAMVQAGPSFNHQVQHQRGAAHVLVTSGIYARLRHPSYFGFFWWALGTQLVMGNVISFFLYTAVLWKFFSTRIRHEEEFLVKFFGDIAACFCGHGLLLLER